MLLTYNLYKWILLSEFQRRQCVDTFMTVKGQIVIPSPVRRKLGMKEGTRIQVDVNETTHQIILTPITKEFIEGLKGRYKGKGLLKALLAEKKREREI